jgi:hypothetical protein
MNGVATLVESNVILDVFTQDDRCVNGLLKRSPAHPIAGRW